MNLPLVQILDSAKSLSQTFRATPNCSTKLHFQWSQFLLFFTDCIQVNYLQMFEDVVQSPILMHSSGALKLLQIFVLALTH